ncbi:hypothetical protein [Streptomyces sp. NPDC002671]
MNALAGAVFDARAAVRERRSRPVSLNSVSHPTLIRHQLSGEEWRGIIPRPRPRCSAAPQQLRSIAPDVVFLGADGLVAWRGLCVPTLEQARLKHVMLYAARTAVVSAEHSKLGAGPFPYRTPLDRPYTLLAPVTSAPVRPAAAQAGRPGAEAG